MVCFCHLQKLGCLCLSKMVVHSEIHYRMLDRACEEGDVVMADCLIQLGTDVNKKTKTESLIYKVTLHCIVYLVVMYDVFLLSCMGHNFPFTNIY